MVVAIEEAVDAIANFRPRDWSDDEIMHHHSMIITLEFLQELGFDYVSLDVEPLSRNN